MLPVRPRPPVPCWQRDLIELRIARGRGARGLAALGKGGPVPMRPGCRGLSPHGRRCRKRSAGQSWPLSAGRSLAGGPSQHPPTSCSTSSSSHAHVRMLVKPHLTPYPVAAFYRVLADSRYAELRLSCKLRQRINGQNCSTHDKRHRRIAEGRPRKAMSSRRQADRATRRH